MNDHEHDQELIIPFRLLKTEDLEAMLQTSGRTIQRMIENGTLPPPIFFSKRMRRWRQEDIMDCLEQRART